MAELNVEIVAVERELWSGKATFVFTRTTAGEIGILPRHIPLVAQLVDDAMVRVEREGEDDLRIAVDGGFLSVTEERSDILVENAEFESEINADAAKQDSESDDPDLHAVHEGQSVSHGIMAFGARVPVRPETVHEAADVDENGLIASRVNWATFTDGFRRGNSPSPAARVDEIPIGTPLCVVDVTKMMPPCFASRTEKLSVCTGYFPNDGSSILRVVDRSRGVSLQWPLAF